MTKQVALFRRNPALDQQAFKTYYEQNHVPLVMSHGAPFLTGTTTLTPSVYEDVAINRIELLGDGGAAEP